MPGYDKTINTPIELLRTVVAIVEAGSFTKAAMRLGISQPGVSAQIKKLQILVGGPVFERSTTGILLTERGKTLLPLAKQILGANDQILRIGGAARDRTPTRVGTNAIFSRLTIEAVASESAVEVNVLCDESDEIAKGLQDGYIDIGCLIGTQMNDKQLVVKWDEELVWVRARDFVLSPGSPIPIVGWPRSPQDRIAIAALQQRGLAYWHVFVAADLTSCLTAVARGVGLMPLMARAFRGELVIANEYYLPPLGKVEAGICLRDDLVRERVAPLLDRLVAALRPATPEPAPPNRPTTFPSLAPQHTLRADVDLNGHFAHEAEKL